MTNLVPMPPALHAYEVADLLGVHVNTVKRIPPAQLPYFRVGRRGDRRYLAEDVLAYITGRMVRS